MLEQWTLVFAEKNSCREKEKEGEKHEWTPSAEICVQQRKVHNCHWADLKRELEQMCLLALRLSEHSVIKIPAVRICKFVYLYLLTNVVHVIRLSDTEVWGGQHPTFLCMYLYVISYMYVAGPANLPSVCLLVAAVLFFSLLSPLTPTAQDKWLPTLSLVLFEISFLLHLCLVLLKEDLLDFGYNSIRSWPYYIVTY